MSQAHNPCPLGYALFRDGEHVGTEKTLQVAKHWVDAEIVPLVAMRERDALLAAIERTLAEEGHLADGENCTLIVLKRALVNVKGGVF